MNANQVGNRRVGMQKIKLGYAAVPESSSTTLYIHLNAPGL